MTPTISVRALAARDRCRRQYALQYAIGIEWPGVARPPNDEMRLGESFHRLVQRHRLGLPPRPEGELGELWARFLTSPYVEPAGPDAPGAAAVRSEQVLQFGLAGVPFFVRCDEIRREGANWLILDWKTGPPRIGDLAHDWQTRLYRFALAYAGAMLNGGEPIPASSIKMVYWLVRLEKAIAFPYSETAFAADREEFEALARQAEMPLDSLPWPADDAVCRACRYDSLCNTRPAAIVAPPRALSLPRFVT